MSATRRRRPANRNKRGGDVQLSIGISRKLAAALKRRAIAEDRTVASLVRHALGLYVRTSSSEKAP